MVGVPGRSKGCNTCIQRKIRVRGHAVAWRWTLRRSSFPPPRFCSTANDATAQCDQETPLCGNCRKSNRICTGYTRRLGFVISQDAASHGLIASDKSRIGQEEGATSVTHHGRWRKAEPRSALLAAFQHQRAGAPSWTEHLLSPSLPGCISAKPMTRQQFHYLFLNQYLPAETLDANSPKSFLPSNWALQLQDVEMQSPALKTSTAALFAARVAQANGDDDLSRKCRSLYVEGLKQLRIAMANPRDRLSDETLAACMALSLYELTDGEGPTSAAYRAHLRGAMTLLELRGPDASATPLGHSLFVDLRAHDVSTSYLR